jgi:hypothetical protein
MYQVFLSHSTADADLGLLIQAEVERTGRANVYLAEQHPQLGRQLADKIRKAILQSDAVVVLLTLRSQTSTWVNQEIGFALRDKLVIPLVEAGVDKSHFALLAGYEYTEFDPADPATAIETLRAFVVRKADQKDLRELIAILVLVGVVAVIALGSEGSSR